MKRSILLFYFLTATFFNFAQTWSNNVAQIVYDKCTRCHHYGGIGGFSLTTYNETSAMATAIYDAVTQERMPPWPPDNNYQQYVHDRALSPSEKTTMLDWITNGYPEGNAANTPPPPVFSNGTVLGNGDLVVQMPTYMSKATINDDYACFAVPTGLLQGRTIKSVEIVPGNRQIVHHALIYIDPTGVELSDSVGGNCASPANSTTKLLAGYTPGASPMTLPSVAPLKLGFDLPGGSQVYFAMHYPAGSYGQYDSTKVIFHFYPVGTTGVRMISADPIIQNWSFSLPNNQMTNVSAQYPNSGGVPANVSVMSVFPHMHLLGQHIKSYAFNPLNVNDTVKFINVPDWDFHWQDFYFFKQIQKVPTGFKIKGEGSYLNTTGSTITAGLNTSDEMFLVYFHYMLYQNGDENYDMESLMSASLDEQIHADSSPIMVYPNPFTEGTMIAHPGVNAGDVISVSIYDYQGKLIRKLVQAETAIENGYHVSWDGNNTAGAAVRNGIYFVSININGVNFTKQLIKN